MISTCEPAGTRTPVISVSRTTRRPKARTGDSNRTTSLIAFGIRSGSRLSKSHCSGWVANSANAVDIALIVVSSAGPR